MAIRCRQAGIGPLRVIEKADGIGGTWHDNTYPGAACDVPSHLYSLSFAPKADWSRMYAPQPEILAYLRETADRHGLMPLIQLGHAFTGATWDAARALWHVETDRGPITARAIVSGMGGLHHPAYPDIPGRAAFAGPAFHTAAWDHSVDLAGKRVGVIGTGASAIQVVPGACHGRGPPDPVPAHAALDHAQERPRHRGAGEEPLPAPAVDPAARTGAAVLAARGARAAGLHQGLEAHRPGRGPGPPPSRQGGPRQGPAGEADAELSARLQARADLRRLLPGAPASRTSPWRRGHRPDRRRPG